MLGLDQMQEQESPNPEPARPILASHLLDLEEQRRTRFTGSGKSERLTTNCAEIDELFGGGGVERGIVVGISAAGSEASLISLHLLATVLLESIAHSSTHAALKNKAIVIDSTGAFPISLLAKVIRVRILEERSAAAIRSEESGNYDVSLKEGHVNQDEKEVDAEVHRCLEMVALCRVFDIEGLWEVLGEVRKGPAVLGELHEHELRENAAENVFHGQKKQGEEKQSLEKTAEIVDSEEEDSPINEMSPYKSTDGSAKEADSNDDEEGYETEIMVIDSMTHIINELFSRKEKTDAHTLLSLLSQTLHNLTHTQNILTILHNTTVPTKPSKHSLSYHQPQQQPSHTYTSRGQPQPPPQQTFSSVFTSNQVKPALGQIFSQFPELHLFLSELPKYRTDAEVLYGQDPEPGADADADPAADRTRTEVSGSSSSRRVGYCTVAEVLKDETPSLGSYGICQEQGGSEPKRRQFGWRQRRWCAIESSADGVMLRGAFAVKNKTATESGGARRFGKAVDGRVGLGVCEVAKVYGFGGRRV